MTVSPVIFRLSQKLAGKLKEGILTSLPLDEDPYADWSAHLFTADRAQYIIVTNTKSLYSVVMYGRGIANDGQFIDRALSSIQEFMEDAILIQIRQFGLRRGCLGCLVLSPQSGILALANRSILRGQHLPQLGSPRLTWTLALAFSRQAQPQRPSSRPRIRSFSEASEEPLAADELVRHRNARPSGVCRPSSGSSGQ